MDGPETRSQYIYIVSLCIDLPSSFSDRRGYKPSWRRSPISPRCRLMKTWNMNTNLNFMQFICVEMSNWPCQHRVHLRWTISVLNTANTNDAKLVEAPTWLPLGVERRASQLFVCAWNFRLVIGWHTTAGLMNGNTPIRIGCYSFHKHSFEHLCNRKIFQRPFLPLYWWLMGYVRNVSVNFIYLKTCDDNVLIWREDGQMKGPNMFRINCISIEP